ncbi:MAG: L-rhamnose mutarotase [Actinomycetes bacterium]
MERVCFTFDIYAGKEAEYKKRHDEIWPELVAELEAAGYTNYTIFQRGLTMVGYLECVPDKATAFGKMANSEVNAKWAKWFEEIIVNLTDGYGNLLELKEIWHMD